MPDPTMALVMEAAERAAKDVEIDVEDAVSPESALTAAAAARALWALHRELEKLVAETTGDE